MLGGDGLSQRASGLRIGELARLPVAKRQAVRITRLRTEHIEAPGSREPMVGSEDGGVEKRLGLCAANRTISEFLDGAPLLDDFGNWHERKVVSLVLRSTEHN